MSYTLQGNILSTCAARVLVTAAQIGVDLKLESCEFTDIYKPEWKQPFNQMPYFIDNETGLELFESRAIAKYIAVKAGSDLVPKQSDLEAYALFEQGCSIEQSNWDPYVSGLAYELLFAGMFGLQTDEKRVEKLKADFAKRLLGYEKVLSKQKWIGSKDKMTVADISHLSYGSIVVQLGVAPTLTDGSLPHVKAWWEALTALPSWQAYEKQKAAAMAAH